MNSETVVKSKTNSFFQKWPKSLLIILPLVFLWTGYHMEVLKFSNDPYYIYLINATAICNGQSVGHIDNPGTTVMQVGALVIEIKHLFSNPENETAVSHVLRDPHTFIMAIRNALLILNTLAMLLLGWVALKKTRSFWLAILLQSVAFISINGLDHIWTKVSPEPMLFFVSCFYSMAILYFYADEQKNSWKYVIAFALITGAGLGTKATFLPLVIFPFVVLPTVKNKFAYLFAVIPSFVLFTIPAIPKYKSMFLWFRDLIGHSGTYGQGNKGIIDTATYFPNIIRIIENNPIFAWTTITGTVVILIATIIYFIRKKPISREVRLLAGTVATSVFGILLVAKHYFANHYLVPVLLLTGVNVFFILNVFRTWKYWGKARKFDLPILVILLLSFLIWKQPVQLKDMNKNYTLSNAEKDSTTAMLARDYADYTQINNYVFSINKFNALKFGDVYTAQKLLPNLKEIYPETYFYEFYNNQISNWNIPITLEEIIAKKGNKILMVNGTKDEKEIAEMSKKGFPLINIYKGRVETIHILDTIKYNEIRSINPAQ